MSSADVSNGLHEELEALALRNRARAIGVALHDLETGLRFSLRGDRWEFQAVQNALSRGLPILAICKGLQVFNVALGGTLKLDIKGHNLPEQKNSDVQSLRSEQRATHRFERVNSAHHQAIDRLGDDLEVEAWAAHDEVIEQVRLRKYPFGLAVQYHPERSRIYDSLFDDFFARLQSPKH